MFWVGGDSFAIFLRVSCWTTSWNKTWRWLFSTIHFQKSVSEGFPLFCGKDALPGFCATLWYQLNIHPKILMVDQDGSRLNRSFTERDTSRFLWSWASKHKILAFDWTRELGERVREDNINPNAWAWFHCFVMFHDAFTPWPLIHRSHKPIQPTTPGSLRMFSTDWTPLTAAVFAGKEAVVKAPLQP